MLINLGGVVDREKYFFIGNIVIFFFSNNYFWYFNSWRKDWGGIG